MTLVLIFLITIQCINMDYFKLRTDLLPWYYLKYESTNVSLHTSLFNIALIVSRQHITPYLQYSMVIIYQKFPPYPWTIPHPTCFVLDHGIRKNFMSFYRFLNLFPLNQGYHYSLRKGLLSATLDNKFCWIILSNESIIFYSMANK